ncbi:MAG: 2,3-bisphosphoglycerate-dependent phosphoglycerate mutase [Candidatus Levyibacteriota bacterium]
MSYLVLVRHGLSEYNKKGLWTGWTDVSLAPEGIEQAKKTGEELKDIRIDYAYTSDLKRTQETLHEILQVIGQFPEITSDKAFNERNYGIYTGRNKWDVKKEVGEEKFLDIRRVYDYSIPEGESLKQVYEREVPYYKAEIEPKLMAGKNVVIASSGNPLRALVKYLENISDEDIDKLEIGTGEAYVYQIDSNGKVINKEIRGKNPMAGKV